jgi:small subunit ribosomal protein S1
MENNETPKNSAEGDDFSKLLGEYSNTVSSFERDQLISGKILTISDREILIELGAKSEGIVYGKDIDALPKDVRSALKVGDEVYAYVVMPEDDNGNVVLSLSKAITEKDWRYAQELNDKQEAIEAMIAGFNKGGVIIKVGRLRGFVPASQLSLAHQRMLGDESLPPEQRFQKLVGQKALIKVVEIDRDRNRLILSERAASKEARNALKDKLLASIEPGQELEGVVSSVKDFGAFVDLGGADGMIHLSEVSHQRIKHPSEILREGQKIKVKVLSVEKDAGRIALSLKSLQADPWSQVAKKYKAGQLVEAEVIKVHNKHGVFARLKEDEAIEGLIPLSELAEKQVTSPREVVKEGQVLTLRILRVDAEAKRIALSLRRVNRPEYADSDWQEEIPDIPDLPDINALDTTG